MGKKRRLKKQQQPHEEIKKDGTTSEGKEINSNESKNKKSHRPKELPEGSKSSSSSSVPPLSRRIGQLPLPFPAHLPVPSNGFLRNEPPYEESFRLVLETAYEGLEVDLTLPNESSSSSSSSQSTYQNQNSNPSKIIIDEATVQQALEEMERTGFFRTDVTQPFGLGTKCAKTYVTRCLVGAPGTTYKYLGLRMFAFSWDTTQAMDTHDDSRESNQRSGDYDSASVAQVAKPLQVIYQLKQVLKQRTRQYLTALQEKRRQRSLTSNTTSRTSSSASPAVGRDEFDICLINRMEYSPALKLEPTLLQHRTAVSWHADSSLEHYSTIAVYQTLVPMNNTTAPSQTASDVPTENARKRNNSNKSSKSDKEQTTTERGGGWTVALRVSPNAEGPDASRKRDGDNKNDSDNGEEDGDDDTTKSTAPPIAVSLPSGSVYYLLDDFNHHHQHAVLTEDKEPTEPTVRYSCTYRLLRTSHNVDYLLERGLRTCRNFHKKGIKMWRSEQLLLTEMESDWIRQFYIQGQEHHNLLWKDWKEPMQGLLRYWSQLETRTKHTIDLLTSGAAGRCQSEPAVTSSIEMSRSERKLREKRKKAYQTLQELVTRSDSSSTTVDQTDRPTALELMYEPLALLLEERATMRELWAQREKEYVFQELEPKFRPLGVPLDFGVVSSVSTSTEDDAELGTSPLKGTPMDLRTYAAMLRECGQAFVSGRTEDLPNELIQPNKNEGHAAAGVDEVNRHSKPIDWNGWQQQHNQFALEMQSPWAKLLLEGKKTIETRTYTLPSALLGKKIWILQSPKGVDGVSSTPNLVDLNNKSEGGEGANGGVHVVGWCKFSSVKTYNNKKEFAKDESAHLVSRNSGYGWVKGKTDALYGWVVNEYGSCHLGEATRFSSASRRMRSLFELQGTICSRNAKGAPSKSSQKRLKNAPSSEREPKKRKRF